MKTSETVVETYFQKELSDITFDNESLDKWKDLATSLGMDKQIALTVGKSSAVPFPYMNQSMKRVYETLCPEKVNYKDYNKMPIPLEVMETISFCVKENHFQTIEIWYDDKSPDPIVVGLTEQYYCYLLGGKKSTIFNTKEELNATIPESEREQGYKQIYTTDTNHYIVARWGDVKRAYNELVTMAIDRFIDKNSNELQKELTILNEKLKLIKNNAVLYMSGDITRHDAIGKY